MRKKYLICYDISDKKRRVKTAKELLKWTFRIQKSVYEGTLTEREVKILLLRLKEIINCEKDLLYIFPISKKEENKILREGVNTDIYQYADIFM